MNMKELIFNDLVRFCSAEQDAVASEESIRLMIEMYKRKGQLVNPVLMVSTEVVPFIKNLNKQKVKSHDQLIVESGSRSLKKQGEHDSIHYTAMDVFCDESGRVTVFIADHYHGKLYHSYKKEYEDLKLNPAVHFIVAGATRYQSDATSCPIFSLQHLLLTAQDHALCAELVAMPQPTDDNVTKMPWFELPPQYNVSTQSFTEITRFVDSMISNKRTKQLWDAWFDVMIAENLQCNAENKIQNKTIKSLAIQFARDAFLFLETITEKELITMCYHSRYPEVESIMHKALSASNLLDKPELPTGHPLFDVMFSNQPFFHMISNSLANSAKKKKLTENFYHLMANSSLLCLMKSGCIDPSELFKQLTKLDGNVLVINAERDKIYTNLKLCDIFVDHLKKSADTMSSLTMIELLTISKAFELMSIPLICEAYFSGTIDNDFFKRMRLDEVRKMSDITLKDMLSSPSSDLLRSPTSVKDGASTPIGIVPQRLQFFKSVEQDTSRDNDEPDHFEGLFYSDKE